MSYANGPVLSGPLAQVLADALHARDAHTQEHGVEHRINEKLETLERLESESVDAVKEMLGGYLNDPEMPAESRELIRQLIEPDHPVQLAALVTVLGRLGWEIAGALLVGPMSRLQTLSLRNFGDYKPDPIFAADAAARHRISDELAGAWAKDNGWGEVDFSEVIDSARQTLPIPTAIALWQQGKIDTARFIDVCERTGVDGRSTEDYQRLRYVPPSAATALNAVTQNMITESHAKELLDQNGIDPANYDWLYETNGQSPGPELLNRLMNYRLIDEDLYHQGILESPIKNKYAQAMENSRFRRPPMEQTLSMVRRGAITPEKGKEYLAFNGYFPEDADALVAWATAGKTEDGKALSVAAIRGMYQEHLIDRGTAESRIQALGYDAEDTRLTLDYADTVRQHQRQNTALSGIRSQFTGWQIDTPTAIGAIDKLGVPPDMRELLIHDWQVVRDVKTRHLTVKQLTDAAKDDLLTENEVFTRIRSMGYSESDTHLIMGLAGIGTADVAPLKDLTVAQILKFTKEGRISPGDAQTRLQNRGYSVANVMLMIESALKVDPGTVEAG